MNGVGVELTEATQALWFVCWERGDIMATIDTKPDGGATLTVRLRSYKDSKAFDSKDEKTWYTVQAPSLENAIAGARVIIAGMKKKYAGESWELLRGSGTIQQFSWQLMQMPFAHTKQVTPEEYQRMTGHDLHSKKRDI